MLRDVPMKQVHRFGRFRLLLDKRRHVFEGGGWVNSAMR